MTKILVEALGWCLISSFWFLEVPVSVIFLIMESPTKFLRLFSWKLFDIVFFARLLLLVLLFFIGILFALVVYWLRSCSFISFSLCSLVLYLPPFFSILFWWNAWHDCFKMRLAPLFPSITGRIVPNETGSIFPKWDWLDCSQLRLARGWYDCSQGDFDFLVCILFSSLFIGTILH